jgi:hypothetical protein
MTVPIKQLMPFKEMTTLEETWEAMRACERLGIFWSLDKRQEGHYVLSMHIATAAVVKTPTAEDAYDPTVFYSDDDIVEMEEVIQAVDAETCTSKYCPICRDYPTATNPHTPNCRLQATAKHIAERRNHV